MPIEVELPDGGIAEFPDGTSPDVITSTLRRQFKMEQPAAPAAASPAPAPEQKREGGALRSFGMGARDVLEGVGGMVGALVNPVANFINRGLGGSGNYFQNPGKALSDVMGLPQAESQDEKLASGAIQGAASVLPTLGFGALPAVTRAAPAVARALTAVPGLQAASGATGGLAGEAARESGAGPVGQAGAALLGGALQLGVVPAARDAARMVGNIAGRYTTAGRERAVGNLLNEFASDAGAVRAALADGQGVILEGSSPTLAQASGDPGLAVLEKGLANVNSTGHGADIKTRYDAQKAARQDALNDVLEPAQQRINEAVAGAGAELERLAPGYQRDPQNIGADMRQAFDEAYSAARDKTRAAYQAIDPEGTASFDLRPLQAQFREIVGTSRYQETPSDIARILNTMQDDITNGVNVGYRELQDMRATLGDLAQRAGASGEANAQRMATGMRAAIDDYLERAAMNPELQGGAPTAQPGSRNYREASAVARDAVNQDDWYNDLAVMAQRGLNREAVEKLGGPQMVEELNRLQPGLVRRNGTMLPDTAASELNTFESLIQETGGGTSHADADAFLNAVLDRLGSSMGRKRQATATVRDDALQQMTAPHTGFTPEQAAAFQEARALRRAQGENFEQGANQALTRRGNKQGGTAIDDSAIPGSYFGSPAGVESFMRSMGESESARRALLDYVVGQALGKGMKNGVIDPKALRGWLDRNAPQLNELAAPGRFPYDMPDLREAVQNVLATQEANLGQQRALNAIARRNAAQNWELRTARGEYPRTNDLNLSAEDRARLDAVRDDAARARDAERRAAVAGSPTAQLQRIESEINGVLDRIPGIKKAPGLRNILSMLLNYAQGNMRGGMYDMLTNATLDPAYALRLMRNAAAGVKPWMLPQTGTPQAFNAVRAMMQGMQGARQ